MRCGWTGKTLTLWRGRDGRVKKRAAGGAQDQAKGWGQEHELKGQTYLGVEEDQEAGEVHTEVGRV